MKICVMQPYFLPYPGYYFLYKYVDVFVILDDVQFNRRGYVHRNKLNINGNIKWLTLPLKKKSREVLINELDFDLKSEQILKFNKQIDILTNNKSMEVFKNDLLNFKIKPLDYINNLNNKITNILGISKKTILSSSLPTTHLKGEEKIIQICKYLKANEYLNLPGGKELYSQVNFKKNNIKLSFIKAFPGIKVSIIDYYKNNRDQLNILKNIDE
jgi:hypothetical protein